MGWLKTLALLISLVGKLTDYLQERKIIAGAEASLLRRQIEAAHVIVNKAKIARSNARNKFKSANGVRDKDDPNNRDRQRKSDSE